MSKKILIIDGCGECPHAAFRDIRSADRETDFFCNHPEREEKLEPRMIRVSKYIYPDNKCPLSDYEQYDERDFLD